MAMPQERILSNLYFGPSNPGSFGGIDNLERESHVTRRDVKDFLLDQVTYTLHHPARRRFQRNPVIATSVGDTCQADLVDMSAFSSSNKGFKYLLTFIDVFSKQAFAVPVKNKTAQNIKKAFTKIFEKFTPFQIQTDRGLEFKNKILMDYMKQNGVNLYFTYNQDIKASVVERFNRTLKGKMFRYFTHKGTRRYIDVLDQLMDSYNRTYHRSIKMRPIDVPNSDPKTVFNNLYKASNERKLLLKATSERQKFEIGDKVRIRYHITPLDKGFYPNFSDQVYQVSNVIKDFPRIMYKVKDFSGQVFPRKLYSNDLLKIPSDPLYRIERIVRKRNTRSGPEGLIKFIGYPDSANIWLPMSSIQNVN